MTELRNRRFTICNEMINLGTGYQSIQKHFLIHGGLCEGDISFLHLNLWIPLSIKLILVAKLEIFAT